MQNINYKIDEALLNIFIDFYGEENREYIMEKFKNVQIIWYDDKECTENDEVHNHIITSIPQEKLDEYLKSKAKVIFLQSAFIDEFNLLILPQNGNLTQIIHECNHMVASHVLSQKPLKFINGISTTFQITQDKVVVRNEFLNEIINQLMVVEMLNSMNIQADSSWQAQLFPLVSYFYESFKSELKKLYISGDLDEFKSKVGEEILEEFEQIIFLKAFRLKRKMAKGEEFKINENDISRVEALVDEMLEHYRQNTLVVHKNK